MRPAIQPTGYRGQLPFLPHYVHRQLDTALQNVVDQVMAGSNKIAVLVGDPSTGKTRACWEAVQRLPSDWRIWHPIDPTYKQALVEGISDVGPRTVVWLNDADHYLAGADGEIVAAKLRVLYGSECAPVLILLTLSQSQWSDLTDRSYPDKSGQARQLLEGQEIIYVPSFLPGFDNPSHGKLLSPLALNLQQAARRDPRWAEACAQAEDGRYIQYLGGGQDLRDRYVTAPAAVSAMIDVAIDLRRFRYNERITLSFLIEAAADYLTDLEYSLADWDAAIDFASELRRGAHGLLRRFRPRSAVGDDSIDSYQLDTYIEQYGLYLRRDAVPPVSFWSAVEQHLDGIHLNTLANLAAQQQLLRVSAELWKRATILGNFAAAVNLSALAQLRWPNDLNPQQWIAQNVVISESSVELLIRQWDKGATTVFLTLARRIVCEMPLERVEPVAMLLEKLIIAEASPLIEDLIRRDPAGTLSVESVYEMSTSSMLGIPSLGDLVDCFRACGAVAQADRLLGRMVIEIPLGSAANVATVLGALRNRSSDHVRRLLQCSPAESVRLDRIFDVARLLDRLYDIGIEAAAELGVLANRVAVEMKLQDPEEVVAILNSLHRAQMWESIAQLLDRDPVRLISFESLSAVVLLLQTLGAVESEEAADQFMVLVDRSVTQSELRNPYFVALLLRFLWDQRERLPGCFEELLARNPADEVDLINPDDVADLIDVLRETCACEELAKLLARNPGSECSLDNLADPRQDISHFVVSLQLAGGDITEILKRVDAHPFRNGNPTSPFADIIELRVRQSWLDFNILVDQQVIKTASDGSLAWRGYGEVPDRGYDPPMREREVGRREAADWTWPDLN